VYEKKKKKKKKKKRRRVGGGVYIDPGGASGHVICSLLQALIGFRAFLRLSALLRQYR
jgi:hypothetical protein